MSEINPDFSFPLAVPQAIPQTQLQLSHTQLQPLANDGRPLSASPKPKRHAHRRSAAMSEDLSAVELAALTSSPKPADPLNSAKVLSSPKLSSPKGPLGSHLPTPSASHGASASYGSYGFGGPFTPQGLSQGSGQGVSFGVPQQPPHTSAQGRHPGSSLGLSEGHSQGLSQGHTQGATSTLLEPMQSQSPQDSPVHTPPMQSPNLAPQRTPKLAPLPVGKLPSTPDTRMRTERQETDLRSEPRDRPLSGLRSPSRLTGEPIGEPGWLVPTPVVSPAPPPTTSKHKKRRSFVQMFRRSSDQSELPGETTLQEARASPSTDVVEDNDDTLVAPVVTPRHSGTPSSAYPEPQQPTIDLNEALGCSFSHRPPDHAPDPLLESPFSKTSSMGAVLEEDEDEDGSEADSLFSVPRQRRRPASFLHASIPVGSPRLAPPVPPGSVPSSVPSSAPISQGPHGSQSGPSSQSGTIAYVGPVAQPPSPSGSVRSHSKAPSRALSRSPSRSPRVSFEQVSNLAISDPPPSVNPAITGPSLNPPPPLPVDKAPTTHSRPAKGHHRRRSLIDRLIRR